MKILVLGAGSALAQVSDGVIKIGVLNDQSSLYADLAGQGSVVAARMAVEDYEHFPAFDADARLRSWNLWSYIDRRDAAQAVRLALEYDSPGMEVFIIANHDTVMTRPVAELLAEVYPDVPLHREVGPHETLLSIEKARRLLGYEPEHSWRDHI